MNSFKRTFKESVRRGRRWDSYTKLSKKLEEERLQKDSRNKKRNMSKRLI